MKTKLISIILIVFLMISCKDSKEKSNAQEIENPDNTTVNENKTINAETDGFDITKIRVSEFSIEELPFFSLPSGYEYSHKENRDYEALRFWTGSSFETPEGNLFFGRIQNNENKQFSMLELSKNIEKVLMDAGGVKIFEGKVPSEEIAKNEELSPISDYGLKTGAYGFQGYAKTWTYVIRQHSKNVWVQLNESDDNASLHIAILKTKPAEITSTLIKAD